MSFRLSASCFSCFVALFLFTVSGCGTDAQTDVAHTDAEHHDDHGHDHDHEGHDHEGHDHGEHDHEGHDHDHDDHEFDTIAAALPELTELSEEIGAAFTDGEPESAHDSLHHIGDVLGCIESCVKKSDLADEAKDSAAKAVEDLFDSFASLDEKMHGAEGKEYSEVKETIASAIETLTKVSE